MENKGTKQISYNRKVRHDYFIMDTYEAGISLSGTEVKSVRQGMLNLKDSYATFSKGNEVFVKGMHISPYEKGNIFNTDPLRDRKLLLHKSEIRKLIAVTSQQGFSVVPLSVYLKNSLVKIELAVVKGKKQYDKRDDAADRDAKRNIDRVMKERYH